MSGTNIRSRDTGCTQALPNEHAQNKTKKMTSAPSEVSDQPGHLPRLISLHCLHAETLGL